VVPRGNHVVHCPTVKLFHGDPQVARAALAGPVVALQQSNDDPRVHSHVPFKGFEVSPFPW
jgi:hypothetical protein